MNTTTKLRQETVSEAIYDVSISASRRACTLTFSVTPEGGLGFDNRQPGARACANRSVSLALAAEMARVARERIPGALQGRTQRGLAFELRIHSRFYRLGLFRRRTVTTEMGSPLPDAPDFDHNAAWFEHPIRSLPRMIKTLFRK
jgi:hypothetical protein